MVIEAYSVIRMIWYVSFYVIDFVVMALDMLDMIQTVTITLLIYYCILSTTYAINIYNVKISNKNYRILEILWNKWKYWQIYLCCANITIVFVLNVVYTTISFTKRGSKYENG